MQISQKTFSLSSCKNSSNEKKNKYAIIPNTVREDFIQRISTKKTTIKQVKLHKKKSFKKPFLGRPQQNFRLIFQLQKQSYIHTVAREG